MKLPIRQPAPTPCSAATPQRRSAIARREMMAGGILVAAGILLLPTVARMIGLAEADATIGDRNDLLAVALFLNLALLLFGWRRYRDLTREVVEHAAAKDRAQSLASRDALTGFYNRRALIDRGAAALDQATKRRKVLALVMVDLDHFKNVNDVHGHGVGDQLLVAAASAIVQALPPHALAARLGGDEFAFAFAFDADAPAIVDAVAERIVTRLSQPFELGGIRAHVSASLGLARSDVDGSGIDALIRRADSAMYAAKKAGRARFAWFDAAMERDMQARSAIEEGLRTGIPNGEIVPYYEQQIDLATGVLLGFEVLARWNHPTRGLVPPDEFIAIAEEAGLIGELSMAVMRQAFEQARGWDASLTLSVNISPAQLRDPWLAQKIVKLLVETGFPPARLEIEITETALFDNLGLAQSIVGSLKNQGIRVALDDFGTGYSSLAHLRALPFDRIKIDRSFVTAMGEDRESAAIVDAIVKLGGSLGLPITAEGVETAGIGQQLLALGLDKGQGWLFGKPMSVRDTRRLLAERALIPVARDQGDAARKAG